MSGNIDDIINKIKSNSGEENRKLAEELKKGLSADQNEALQKLMTNEHLMKKLLESDQVKNIISKLGGDKNGHK